MSDIRLNFIDNSNDSNNSEVVIFQRNEVDNYSELAVAWKVIPNCGKGDNYPFVFPDAFYISVSDSWGNYTPQVIAQPGQAFEIVLSRSGDVLQLSQQPAASPTQTDVFNNLPKGAVNANVYKNGKLLAIKTNIAPGQKATFSFNPTIWIGVANQVTQGQVMNSAIISTINTELNLAGIASADIVMTGGGPGPNATSFLFELANIVYA